MTKKKQVEKQDQDHITAQEVNEARGFVRGKGIPDHLYTDETCVEKYREYQNASFTEKTNPLDMGVEVEDHIEKDGQKKVLVKEAEYSTAKPIPKNTYEKAPVQEAPKDDVKLPD